MVAIITGRMWVPEAPSAKMGKVVLEGEVVVSNHCLQNGCQLLLCRLPGHSRDLLKNFLPSVEVHGGESIGWDESGRPASLSSALASLS